MLQDVQIEFRIVDNIQSYFKEGTRIEDNENYCCMADGFTYYVTFKKKAPNQLLIIHPSVARNLDPDGGCTFMQKNVKKFIECLYSDATYLV